MREFLLLENLNLVASSNSISSHGPFSHAIHGQNGSLFERRDQKRGGGMREVMLNHQYLSIIIQLPLDSVRYPDFLFEPKREGFQKSGVGAREINQIAGEDSL